MKSRTMLAAALMALLTLVAPSMAHAAGQVAIDPDRTGSLELVALANDDAARDLVAGLVMDLHVVDGVDLSTPEGLEQAEAIIADTDGWDELDTTLVTTLGPTDETGRAWADDLEVGLYVLTQAQDDQTGIDYRSMVFTLPSMSPVEGDGWSYDLRIYPKPVPEDCECEAPEPVEPEPVEPAPVDPGKPGEPAPRPGIPTGEVLAQNMNVIWVVLALVAAAGAATVALRKPRQDAS